jgi:Ca2+-binding EF-hand superfamily protein
MQLAVLLPHVDTFRAYDKDGDNMVSRKEFMQFIEESWKAAFRLLS